MKNDLTVYPQIKYPTQLRAGEDGAFYPNEIDSNGKAYHNFPYLFEWDFGDRTNTIFQKINSSIPNDTYGLYQGSYGVKHTYTHEGSYPVTLKARDSQGNTGTITIKIQVT